MNRWKLTQFIYCMCLVKEKRNRKMIEVQEEHKTIRKRAAVNIQGASI